MMPGGVSRWGAAFLSRIAAKPVTCLILVGMMGAGKTTVGRELARRREMRFADCDHELIARTGVAISVIFDIEGEAGFRQREARMLDELTVNTDIVIATGGGVVLDSANRALLSRRGIVIYLNVPPHILWERTRRDRNRPLLQVDDPRARIIELHRQRDPLYREIADIVIDGGRGGSAVMVEQIEKALAGLGKGIPCTP
jgi:shikimate kinase